MVKGEDLPNWPIWLLELDLTLSQDQETSAAEAMAHDDMRYSSLMALYQ